MRPAVAQRRTCRTVAASVGAAAALLVATLSLAAASPAHPAGSRTTIVLVHGAWADSSSWNEVLPRLRHEGFRTADPDLHLQSLADDVATVRDTLNSIPGKKILVAHSYGGFVIANAAAGRTDVLALVFAAAFVPAEGDSIASLGTGFTPSPAFTHLAFTGAPFGSPSYIAPNLFRYYFAQDLSRTPAGLLNASQQPLNFPIVTTPSGPVAGHEVPSWYAVSGSDRMIDPAEERWMADRAGSHTVEFPGASHVGGITRYAAQLTRLIERAAAATTH